MVFISTSAIWCSFLLLPESLDLPINFFFKLKSKYSRNKIQRNGECGLYDWMRIFSNAKFVTLHTHNVVLLYLQDKDAKFRLILIESRIHRLARYYKTKRVLAPNWKQYVLVRLWEAFHFTSAMEGHVFCDVCQQDLPRKNPLGLTKYIQTFIVQI